MISLYTEGRPGKFFHPEEKESREEIQGSEKRQETEEIDLSCLGAGSKISSPVDVKKLKGGRPYEPIE